jgi:carboxyl-terminal processing protease
MVMIQFHNKKMKKIFRRYRLTIAIACTAVVSFVTYSFTDDYFEISKNLDIFSSLYREVNMYYVDPVDPGKLMKKGMDEMLNTLDPYTNFIPESDIEDYRFMTTGQYGGIGAVIRQKDNFIVVSDPYDGYPAQKAGIIPGDVILEIDGKSAAGKKTDEVSRALKGSPKTQVKLLLRREGEPAPFEKILTREEIKVKSVPWSGMVTPDIAYIRLTNFTENAGKEVAGALKELKEKNDVKGIILDLRGNPGGLLNEAVNVSNVFVDKGKEIVSTKGKIKEHDRGYKSINEAIDKNIAVAVMVNSSSASASEIVSGALQDLDRAVIVGQRTFGKGLVQTTRPLAYNAQLKITTAKYYIPSGRCIQALDYTHRNEDGSVGKVPDSLITEYKTLAGRKVYDGGGILPDVITVPKKLTAISQSLINKSLVFDFATKYRREHSSINQTDFRLTEKDFNDFLQFIAGKEYDYATKSEKSLDELKKNAEEEKYFDAVKTEYEALKQRLSHNKQEDVVKNKAEISALLEEEIAGRYFFQAGRIRQALMNDTELYKAIEVLRKPVLYAGILNGSANADGAAEEEQK